MRDSAPFILPQEYRHGDRPRARPLLRHIRATRRFAELTNIIEARSATIRKSPTGWRLIIATDGCSALGQQKSSRLPLKGRCCAGIRPPLLVRGDARHLPPSNHVIDYPDPNVLLSAASTS